MSFYQLDAKAPGSKLIYIDTRDVVASGGQFMATDAQGDPLTSFFKFNLKTPMEVSNSHQILLSLHSCSIPYSFYNIRDEVNNYVDMTVTPTGGTASAVVLELEAGNYSASSLKDHLIDKFVAANTGLTLTVTYDKVNMKYSFSCVGGTLTIDGATGNTKHKACAAELGLRGDFGVTAVPSKAPFVADLYGSVHGLFIRTDLMQRNVLDSNTNSFGNILARVPIKVQSGGVIFHEPNNSTHKCLIKQRAVDELVIRITDERNRLLDFNGLHLNLAIQLDFLLDKGKVTGDHVVRRPQPAAPPKVAKRKKTKPRKRDKKKSKDKS